MVRRVWVALFFVLFFDVLTKSLLRFFSTEVTIFPFLKISIVHNTGIAFGFFQGFNGFFILISLLVLAYLYYFQTTIHDTPSASLGIGFIMGGALGNLIDRVLFGYVLDFITFSFWPSFNIADLAVTIGVAFIIASPWFDSFFFAKRGKR